jgi:hypothetical protein
MYMPQKTLTKDNLKRPKGKTSFPPKTSYNYIRLRIFLEKKTVFAPLFLSKSRSIYQIWMVIFVYSVLLMASRPPPPTPCLTRFPSAFLFPIGCLGTRIVETARCGLSNPHSVYKRNPPVMILQKVGEIQFNSLPGS